MPEESSRNRHTSRTATDEPHSHERAEISEHLTAVWLAFKRHDLPQWLDSREIAAASDIAPRTARHHVKYLLELGLLDMEESFPRHLYRLSPQAAKRNPGMYQRLDLHAEIINARKRHTVEMWDTKDL
jgi:DNA-binding transcriptional ArsR family regulator